MSKFHSWVVIFCLFHGASAYAQQAAPAAEYSLKHESLETGSHIPRNAVTNVSVPINKPYAELSNKEKAIVRSMYEHLDATDEPPYPLKGTKDILRVIMKAQDVLHLKGDLSVVVEVNADGTPNAVGVLTSPDERMTKIAAMALMEEHYKPALCKGVACKMQFPVRVTLSTSH
ncbi:hypothetical protein ACO0LF_01845 [Undibacterium sp. Di27W]|uniref:hypothetical protein n=1 Tax=Undibacterium sp. Di27W TaxID=3413036 RepID=UPI003BF0A098